MFKQQTIIDTKGMSEEEIANVMSKTKRMNKIKAYSEVALIIAVPIVIQGAISYYTMKKANSIIDTKSIMSTIEEELGKSTYPEDETIDILYGSGWYAVKDKLYEVTDMIKELQDKNYIVK